MSVTYRHRRAPPPAVTPPNGETAPDLRQRVNVVRSTIPAVTHVDYSARVQTVDAVRAHGKFLSAASADRGIRAVERHGEIRFGFVDGQSISKPFASVATSVSDTDEIQAVRRRGEQYLGI